MVEINKVLITGITGFVGSHLADYILATPWEVFKGLTPDDFSQNMKRPRLLDCWRLFNRPQFKEKLEYFAIGLAS